MYLIIIKPEREIENILYTKYNICRECAKDGAKFIREELPNNNFAEVILVFVIGSGILIDISDFIVGECPLVMN